MQILYLIRHAETESNREGRVQGFSESELSNLGREQARLLAGRLRDTNIQAAVSSPAGRAVATARIALDGSIPLDTREGIREMNLGVWEGRIAADIRESHPNEVKLWFERPSQVRIEGAETVQRFRRRVTRTMTSIREDHGDQTVAVITHGGVICAYLTSLLGMKLDDIWRFKIRNGSITRVLFPTNRPRIDLLGDVHHLDGASREIPPNAPRMFP
jgi:broad specificity phosphatase PhoE